MKQITQQTMHGLCTTEDMLQQLTALVQFLDHSLGPHISLTIQPWQEYEPGQAVCAPSNIFYIAGQDGSPKVVVQVRHETTAEAAAALPRQEATLIPFPTVMPQAPAVEQVSNVAAGAVQELVAHYGVPTERLNKEEKLEIIYALHKKGIFLLKGAVGNVARQLHCSVPSVYRYLAAVNRGE